MEQREEVFDRVYREYGPALYRFCLMQMKNAADAEDVMQEVFVKRLYQAPPFQTPEHERRWLFRVALNQCRDEWKRSRRTELPLEAAAIAVEGFCYDRCGEHIRRPYLLALTANCVSYGIGLALNVIF